MLNLTHPLQHISGKDHTDALEDHEGTVITVGKTVINLRFADDIDGIEQERKKNWQN